MPQKFSVIKKFRYIECCTSEHSLGGLIILHNIPALDHAILKFVPPSKVMKHDLSAFSAISMTINDIKGDKFLYRKKMFKVQSTPLLTSPDLTAFRH